MKKLLVLAICLITQAALANEKIYKTGVMKTDWGYVVIQSEGNYVRAITFGRTLKDATQPSEQSKILEICNRDEFKTDAKKAAIFNETLETAANEARKVQVTYFDNGHPLAGMCIESVSLLQHLQID